MVLQELEAKFDVFQELLTTVGRVATRTLVKSLCQRHYGVNESSTYRPPSVPAEQAVLAPGGSVEVT